MRKSLVIILPLLPCSLLGQTITELSPLEYHPPRQEVSTRTPARTPASFAQRIPAPLAYRLGSVRQAEIDAVVRDPQLPLMGLERVIDRRVRPRGQWATLDDGSTVWRVAIQSEGAAGVRVEFSDFHVGAGEVWLYSEDRGQVFGPYTGNGSDDSGEFWSNTIFADTIVLEYQPESPSNSVPFTISKILHRLTVEQTMATGTCELDVSCYADWSAVSSGVGLYFFQKGGAGYACTGALVNNSNKDLKPYFLTANHCVSDAASAKTVNVFWNYQTPSCNGKAPSLAGLPQTLGATYLASAAIGSGDFSLILLTPLPKISLTFYGWNGSTTALLVGDKTTGVHHPQADYKRIAFGVRDPDVTAQIGSEIAPANQYYYVRETSGRIEPGSSGSPLFTQDKVVVGTLTYGPPGDACSVTPFSAGYGRFSSALPALASYLNPAAPGTPPPTPVTVTPAPASIKTNWTMGTTAPAAQNIQLTTTSANTITLTAKTSQTWISLSASSLTLSQSKPATLSVSVSTQTFTGAGANIGSVTLTGTGINQSIAVEVDVTAAATAVKGGPVTVIPLFLDGGGMTTTFTLVNPFATTTVASISFATASGAATTLPLGQAQAAWQNVTIPAHGTATVVTAGSSSPQKQGMAMIQSADPAKRVQAWAQINSDAIAPVVLTAPPFTVPFDATGTAFTTLYLFNPAATGTLTLSLAVFDTGGVAIASGTITIPAQQEGSIPMTRTASGFGGKKGTLFVDGKGPVSVMGIRAAADGRLSSVPPELLTAQ